MSNMEWIILGVIALWAVIAVVWQVRRRRAGKCCCGCSGCGNKRACGGNCGGKKHKEKL